MALALAAPARADGGSGGAGATGAGTGGGGGSDNLAGGTGGPGTAGTANVSGGGGGGGGGSGGSGLPFSGAGGAGGAGSGGAAGGLGATAPFANGGAGSPGAAAGDGGGGGGGGFNDFINSFGAFVSAGSFTESAGGAGGAGNGSGGGGGGGSGGAQLVFVNGNLEIINSGVQRIGGAGGAGGASATGFGGAGGAGGAGAIYLSGGTLTLQTGALLSGGAGGAGGVGGAGKGANGAGGAGLIGAGLTITDNGMIAGGLAGDGVTRAQSIVLTGGNNFITFGTASAGVLGGISVASKLTVNQPTDTVLGEVVSGTGAIIKTGAGLLALTGINSYAGGTTITGGTVQIGNASALGTGTVTLNGGSLQTAATGLVLNNAIALNAAGGSIDTNGFNFQLSGIIADGNGPGNLTKIGAGTLVLTGTSTYTGATIVGGGTLQVDGSIAASSNVTVNAGATLSGIGIVDPATTTIMGGGTLAPGNAANLTGMLTIAGNLAFQSGAIYLVQVTPSTAASTSVSGSATLGGATVDAVFGGGSHISKTYTILTAAGGVSGTFGSLVSTNLPTNFRSSLSYDGNNAYLNLALNFGSGLTINQQNVGNAIANAFDSNGSIPLVFGGLTPAALTQLSGEGATASQETTFDAMNLFIGLLTDPFVSGRRDSMSAGGTATAYADESLAYAARAQGRAKRERDPYAAVYAKAPPVTPFAQRWSVWAAGYGGSQTTRGEPVVLGSNDTRSSVSGIAVGADYRFTPDTIAGFALAGGGTNFSVNTLGSGRSDLFQAGAFVRHNEGSAYITGALAYGWQDVTTNRTVTVAGIDQLRAEFNANAWSGRVEGGYRFVAPVIGGIGITPYAAGQFTTFELPSYLEQAVVGSNQFALIYGSKSATDTRSEVGVRSDKSFAAQNGIFTVRSRIAWAHDYNPDRNIAATFQSLPGASFVVNGARHASESALTTASAEWKWINGWSAAGTFEGDFSSVTRSYAGKGVVRYAW